MTHQDEFDFFTNQLLDYAVKSFRATSQYALLREKLDRMDAECKTMLTPSDQGFVTECFELILDVNSLQEQYVYRQGLSDCIQVLKWLGVLA